MKLYNPSKIQRRLGEKLFLKGERDFTPKSALVRRPYPPGAHGRSRRRKGRSDFAATLAEKQKVRFAYGLSDSVLRKYATASRTNRNINAVAKLLQLLELRLDNAVYRLGFAASRLQSRHLVAYGHVTLNGKPVRSPSLQLVVGDKISICESSRALLFFSERTARFQNYQPPAWLKLSGEEWTGEVARMPAIEDQLISADLEQVIEYYSR